ncbi:hypothetical protein KP79_PYT06894 [Mizuhopecten yessoensis]|uniref:Uncharacterized protein n=1 Tax=Mizuhopecten yessoensis TaxID=6573 RepID=A0A210Q7L5_MIZYE|nr:hypothetical protein KP79_PYT06894 [Mizuhopecten yessoensis]
MQCFISVVGSLYETSLLNNKRPRQFPYIMPSVRGDKSLGGILGILEVEIPLARPKCNARSNTGVASSQNNNVRIHCEDEIVNSECRTRTQNDDTFLISVKIFMSRTQSFGNVGFYLPFDMSIENMHIKTVRVRVVSCKIGEPTETFHGTFRMLRADIAAKLLALPENKRLTSTTIDLKDNIHSATFFSKLKNIYHSQGNEDQVPELEKQTVFEQTNVQVVIQLISVFLTDLRGEGHFPPSPSAGHTHFILPNTRPLALLSDVVDTTKTSIMRLLSFVYTASNVIYPEIARTGFYLIGNTGIVTCTKCECMPRVDVFQQMEQSEFDQMHNFGCCHRKSSEDQLRYLSHNNSRLDIPDVLDGGFLYSFRRMHASSSVSSCQLDAAQSQIGNTTEHNCPNNTTAGHSDRKPRNNVVTIVKKTHAFCRVSSFSGCSFDADTFMHDLTWTYVQPSSSEMPHYPVWSAFKLPSKRSDTFRGSTIAKGLKGKLVENGFFCQRNLIRTFCCDTPYIIGVDKDPAIVHARSSCPRAITQE